MRCVLVSKSLDLRGYLGPQFMRAADRIAVMQHGAIVELKSAALLFAAPEHAYTRELLSAVPGQTSSSKAA